LKPKSFFLTLFGILLCLVLIRDLFVGTMGILSSNSIEIITSLYFLVGVVDTFLFIIGLNLIKKAK